VIITIADRVISASGTSCTARRFEAGWRVSWLPGRVLLWEQALAAVMLASAARCRCRCGCRCPMAGHAGGWARLLGLSLPEARELASSQARE
jgi:hypothetical protein